MVKIVGIQILGAIFGLAMLFVSYVYMKRKDLSVNDFLIWGLAWALFMIVVIFPQTIDVFVGPLRVQGALTLMTIIGFMFILVVVFYLYVAVRKNQKKINELIKHIALKYNKLDNKDKELNTKDSSNHEHKLHNEPHHNN